MTINDNLRLRAALFAAYLTAILVVPATFGLY